MRMSVKGIDGHLGVLKYKKPKKIDKLFEELLDQVDEGTEIDIEKWHRLTLRMPKSLYRLLKFEADHNNIGLAEIGRILLRDAIIARHL